MGLIYVAEGERGVKVGWTVYLHNRIAKLERQTGEQLYLWAAFPGTKEDERDLHERWAHLALGNEWFRATDELLAWADSLDGAA